MLIRVVVVGIGHWEDLTLPFLKGLHENNPAFSNPQYGIVTVDNGSRPPYPIECARLDETVGYGSALNFGASVLSDKWDWLLCCNNDCLCTGKVNCSHLRTDTIYGNEWKYDYDGMQDGLPAVVDSAYLLIPRKVWERLGGFDPKMDAAFEEIDFQIRALDAGYRIDVADLPITHLNLHTRWELEDYKERWEATRKYFRTKHPNRNTDVGMGAPEVNYGS